jgi:hypothetical protein
MTGAPGKERRKGDADEDTTMLLPSQAAYFVFRSVAKTESGCPLVSAGVKGLPAHTTKEPYL